jgi:phage terminase large subunit-like protein
MVREHPDIDRRVTSRHNELHGRGGFLKFMSSDAPRAHGLQPTLVLVDELHAHVSPDLYVALKTSMGKRPGALMVVISTAGYDQETVLGQLRARAFALPALDHDHDGTLTVARDTAANFAMLEWACGWRRPA